MSTFHTIHEPKWEAEEQGWRAVVSLCNRGHKWTAYIEMANTPGWRIWAGHMFATMGDAQVWCRNQIVYQLQQHTHQRAAVDTRADTDGDAYSWIWGNVEPMHNNEFMCC